MLPCLVGGSCPRSQRDEVCARAVAALALMPASLPLSLVRITQTGPRAWRERGEMEPSSSCVRDMAWATNFLPISLNMGEKIS
jgi:hypothetical protein